MKPPWYIDLPGEAYCPYCGGELIELYDELNRPRHYRKLLELHQDDKRLITYKFDRIVLSHFKCNGCNRKYPINWIYGYPVPLIT